MRPYLPALMLVPALAAATPATLGHQGYLIGSGDTPVEATAQALGFSLWTGATSGTQVWPASGDSSCMTDVHAGYYAVLLDGASSGCGAGLTAEAFLGGDRWLQVSVGPVALLPRVRLTPTAAASVAGALATTLGLAGGGTGATDAAAARANLQAAQLGANADITSLTALTTAITLAQGGTGAATAATARTNLGAAASGTNADITAITGLTTALSVAQGGTGTNTLTANRVLMGNGTGAIAVVGGGSPNQVLALNASSVPTWTNPSGATQWTTTGSDLSYSLGKVGIGTTATAAVLQVRVGTDKNIAFNTDTSGGTNEARISAYNDAPSASVPLYVNGSYLGIQTGGVERARFDASGNLGLGTTAPAAKLDVNGAIKSTGTGGNVPHNCRRVQSSANLSNGFIGACPAGSIALSGGPVCSESVALRYLRPVSDTQWEFQYVSSCATVTLHLWCCDI